MGVSVVLRAEGEEPGDDTWLRLPEPALDELAHHFVRWHRRPGGGQWAPLLVIRQESGAGLVNRFLDWWERIHVGGGETRPLGALNLLLVRVVWLVRRLRGTPATSPYGLLSESSDRLKILLAFEC